MCSLNNGLVSKYLPQLSLKERDRRWDGIRKKMLLANIDVLVFMGNDAFFDMGLVNLRYVTQVGPKTGAHALFFIDRDPIIWHARPHTNRPTNMHLSTQEWVQDFRIHNGVPEVAAAIREAGLAKNRVGMVSFGSAIMTTPTFLHGDVLNYQKELPGFDFVDANWVIEQMRLIKSEEEIAMLAKAGTLARKTIDTMIEYARPGMTEAGLYAEMIRTQIANGCEPQIFNLLASGPVEHPTKELWHLLHGAEQPMVPSTRPERVPLPLRPGRGPRSLHASARMPLRSFRTYTGFASKPCTRARKRWSRELPCARHGKRSDGPQKRPGWISLNSVSTGTALPPRNFRPWSIGRVTAMTA